MDFFLGVQLHYAINQNVIILNKGESCVVTPDSRALFWGTEHYSINPISDKYGYNCYPAYAAQNPVTSKDFDGQECNNVQDVNTISFAYEWNLYNWIEIETWFINEQEKNVDFSTDNIPTDKTSTVDYLIELRDDEGDISPIPITIYEDYSSAQHYVMMDGPGIVSQYAKRDSHDWWTEGGIRIPAGYDFRIRALNNDQPIGVYIGGSEQIETPAGWDENGFRKTANDLAAGEFIVEEYFINPTEEIRVEKVAINAPEDAKFTFTATKTYPYYNWCTHEKFENVQMPLNNYPYTVYSSAGDTEIGEYTTSENGNFSLQSGQYAIFKVWKMPEGFLSYDDGGSTFWDGYDYWDKNGDPMPNSATYTFIEQDVPNCVTTIEHIKADGTSDTINTNYVDNVNNSDRILFRNVFDSETDKTGSLTISKKVTGTGTPDADTLFEFTVTKARVAASGQYSVDGSEAQAIPTDGKISITAGQSALLTGLDPGEYMVTETTPAQANYKSTTFSVNGEPAQSGCTATVTVSSATTVAFTNDYAKKSSGGGSSSTGAVNIIKTDSTDKQAYLSGAKFEIYTSAGKLIGSYTTDEQGQIKVEKLATGKYYAVEIAPPTGYTLDSSKHEFTITGGKTTSLTLTNKRTGVPDMLNGDDHFAYIIGRDDGLVHPEAPITRAEVTTIFFRLLTAETRDGNLSKTNAFSDVKQGMWFNTAISTMSKLGIVHGRTNTTFEPNAYITRAEFAAIAARFDKSTSSQSSHFSDISGHWAEAEINKAAANGWVNGYSDGTFKPDQNITRAEAMALINRVLNRSPETTDDLHQDMIKWPDALKTDAWYYLDVQEATNSHDYNRKTNGCETWTKLTKVPDWKSYEIN